MSEVVTKIISETLASGVEPLRRRYYGVYDGYDDMPVAYVVETEVFLSATGVITGYEQAIDDRAVGIKWSISNIAAAYRALQRLREKDKKAAFITASVTTSFLESDVEKSLLSSEKARKGAETLRAMGYGAAIFGFSGAQSLNSVTEAPVDYVFLSSEVTALSGDRDKPGVFTALMSLLRALRCEIVLCGVKNDDVIRDATASECFGVMPDAEYQGEFSFPMNGVEIDTILQGEDDAV